MKIYNKLIRVAIVAIIIIVILLGVYLLTGINKEGLADKDYLDGIDVIYWINLDRSPDRRERMETMFKDPVFEGKKIIRIQAVDGKAPNFKNIMNPKMRNNKCTDLENAATMSHLKAIKQFSQSKSDIALIMEDDASLEYKPKWKKTTKQVMDEAPIDWEIIQLSYMVKDSNKIPDKLYTNNKNKLYFGGCAYLIKNNDLDKLLNNNSIIDEPLDIYLFGILNTYTYKFPFFTYKDYGKSTIQPNTRFNDKTKSRIDEYMLNP